MLTDRRPILLANARLIDPSRDFDGPGDVLIVDGMIRIAGAVLVRRRARRHRHRQLRRQDRRPGLIDMRAPLSASPAPAIAKPCFASQAAVPAASPPSSASPTPRR
jgi:dihydroorotase